MVFVVPEKAVKTGISAGGKSHFSPEGAGLHGCHGDRFRHLRFLRSDEGIFFKIPGESLERIKLSLFRVYRGH